MQRIDFGPGVGHVAPGSNELSGKELLDFWDFISSRRVISRFQPNFSNNVLFILYLPHCESIEIGKPYIDIPLFVLLYGGMTCIH